MAKFTRRHPALLTVLLKNVLEVLGRYEQVRANTLAMRSLRKIPYSPALAGRAAAGLRAAGPLSGSAVAQGVCGKARLRLPGRTGAEGGPGAGRGGRPADGQWAEAAAGEGPAADGVQVHCAALPPRAEAPTQAQLPRHAGWNALASSPWERAAVR